MRFMKLIFVDRTHEERTSLSPHEFYTTAKKISEQEFGVSVRGGLPQTRTQKNPLGHHQEHDFYRSLIIDLRSQSEHILNLVRARLKHLGKESGWELAKYHISNTFEDTIYATSLSDDWFRKQAWYNHERDNALRQKSLVKIPAAAFYFARISRDIRRIAQEFDVTEWTVRKWANTYEWETALKAFGYTGDHSFATKPTRDTKRDNGKLFDKAHKAYTQAITEGEPKHKLATIAGNAVGLPRRRIHDWATKYSWKENFSMTFESTTYAFEKLREAIYRPETGHSQLAAVEGGYIDRILGNIEQFKNQLQAQGRSDESQSVNETLEELEYPVHELRKYFRGNSNTHINKKDAEIFISHLYNHVQEWKRWCSREQTMNEITTTMSDWSKDRQEFASIIIDIVEHRHAKYEREYREGKESKRVPLADIKFCPKCFENFPHVMQGIKPYQKPESTIQEMLNLFCQIGEIKIYSGKVHRLNKEGLLYKHLTEKLASTS